MSKKLLITALVAGLLTANLAAPVEAAKKKKVKPVATTLFMEGSSNFGEEDQLANGTYLKLQTAEGSGQKSAGVPNYVGGPNTTCAGNSLVPVFVGSLAGKVVGDMKVTFDAAATPGAKVEVRVWPDLAAQACNESYIAPAGSAIVDLPAGQGTVEAVIEDLDFEAIGGLMIQVTPVIGAPPSYSRVFYGTADSKVEFSCIPASGKTCAS
jgi:hypothetical protein